MLFLQVIQSESKSKCISCSGFATNELSSANTNIEIAKPLNFKNVGADGATYSKKNLLSYH